jgi:hypothetical protein
MRAPGLTLGTMSALMLPRFRGSVMGILNIDSDGIAAGQASANVPTRCTMTPLKVTWLL